jgi:hypothetical protein
MSIYTPHVGSNLIEMLRLFTMVDFITLFSKMSHQLCNRMKYPLSIKSFISLFSRLTSVIKYNDVMIKYSLSDETIWLTMGISFRFIRLKNRLALCHGDATDFLSLINTIKPSTMNRLKVSSDRDI